MQGFRRHLFLTEKSRKSITPPRAPSTPLPAIVSPISPTGAWPLFYKGPRARAHVGVCGGVRIWDDHRRPRNGSTGRLIDPENGKQRSLLSDGKGEPFSASPAASGCWPGAQGAWPSVTASRSRSATGKGSNDGFKTTSPPSRAPSEQWRPWSFNAAGALSPPLLRSPPRSAQSTPSPSAWSRFTCGPAQPGYGNPFTTASLHPCTTARRPAGAAVDSLKSPLPGMLRQHRPVAGPSCGPRTRSTYQQAGVIFVCQHLTQDTGWGFRWPFPSEPCSILKWTTRSLSFEAESAGRVARRGGIFRSPRRGHRLASR